MINLEKELPTNTLFTLIFAERPATSDALIALNGPTLHISVDDAVLHLFEYVKDRIVDCCLCEFVEWGQENLESFVLSTEELDADNEDVKNALNRIKGVQIEQVVNWYFGYMQNELCEAFYKIEQHEINQVDDSPGHLPGATKQLEIFDVCMVDLFGDYDTPDEVPEWKWVEDKSSFEHRMNRKYGIWEYIINLDLDLTDIPEKLKQVIDIAKKQDCGYIHFHQGT